MRTATEPRAGKRSSLSFSPLPESLQKRAAQWAALAAPRLLDLGCGTGEVGRWLAPQGVPVWGLDRLPVNPGGSLHVRGDALNPPIVPGSLDGVLAANLVHHALAQDPSGTFLRTWLGLLKPGGVLFLLGDQPEPGRNPAARNFQKLQEFLADIMPGTRGPLVGVAKVSAALERQGAGQVRHGTRHNEQSPDSAAVLAMLAGSGSRQPGGAAERLIEAIHREGLAYGRYWWVEAHPR